MRYLTGLLFFLLVSSLISGCTGSSNPAIEDETDVSTDGKIIYGLTLSVSGIDPHINQSSELGIVLRQVYDTLLYRHPETQAFVPGLATEWRVSDDGLKYTLSLREGVQFHDGTAFNAAAVGANIERIMDPETGSQKARFLLGPLSGYRIVDDYTIELILSEPYSPLLDALSQVYVAMASPAALDAYSLLRYQYHQVGTGPFEFVEYVPEDRIVIRRNPDYDHGPEFYDSAGPASIQEVEFRFFNDPATRALQLEQGNADIMGELLPVDARALANNTAFQLVPVAVPGQPLQFYMNTQEPPTDDLAVRQALLYATNRNAIVDAVYRGFSPVAWGPFSAEAAFYNAGVQGVYEYDASQARTLLASAGYTDSDNDGYVDRDGERLEVRLIQPPWGQVPEVVQFLQDQWRFAGIFVDVVPVPGYTSLVDRVMNDTYNLVAFDTFGIDPSIINPYFLSDSDLNWSGFSSDELDSLLIQATRESNPETRGQLYGQIQATILQNALIVPIRDYVNLNAHSTRIENLVFDPYGWFPLLQNARLSG